MKKWIESFVNFRLVIILVALCFYAIHDSQTAYGVGYFFCLKMGMESNLVINLLTDMVFLLMLLALTLLPAFIVCRQRKVVGLRNILGSFCKIFVIYCALMPIQRTDYIISVFRAESYGVTMTVAEKIGESAQTLKIIFPFLVLFVGFSVCIRGVKPAKRSYLWVPVMLMVLLTGLIVPALLALSLFLICYGMVWSIFALSEKGEFDSNLFYGFLFLVSIYKLVYVTAI